METYTLDENWINNKDHLCNRSHLCCYVDNVQTRTALNNNIQSYKTQQTNIFWSKVVV
jgi:hypothetical protein